MVCIKYGFATWLLFALFFTGSANAQWTEARSENFVFVGNYTESGAEVVVSELEEYRAVIFEILGLEEQADPIAIPIYGVRSAKVLQEATGNSFAAGIYTTTREGPVFGLSLDGGFIQTSPARQTAYHEFTHHIVQTYTNQVYPRWYSEGLADYLSTFEVSRRGKIKIGLPSEYRSWVLRNKGWMSMDVLIGSVRKYPFGNSESGASRARADNFYAQSWLAAHYINSKPEMIEKFGRYLDALNSETGRDNAFEQSFEMTPDEFGAELKQYLRVNRFPNRSGRLDSSSREFDISIRQLSKAETDFHRGELTRRFYDGEDGFALAETYYKKSEEAGGPLADIAASRALLAFRNEEFEAAFTEINTALERAPQNSRYLQIAGQIYLSAYEDGQQPITRVDEARVFLRQAIEIDPGNVSAHYYLASSYAVANDLPPEQAYQSASIAGRYYRSNNFTDSNLGLAEVLMRTRAAPLARGFLEKAKAWSQSARTRSRAARELTMLEDMLAGRAPLKPSPGGQRD